jgi:MFS family permease
MRFHRDLLLIYVAAAVRAFGIGLLGVVLGVYFSRMGFGATRIGLAIAVGLTGATVATFVAALSTHRFGYRRALCVLALLSCIGGLGLALTASYGVLLMVIFVGMVNGMGTDRSASFALEQAIIPGYTSEKSRTWALSWYNVVLDASGAVGALAGGVPLALQSWVGVELTLEYRYLFVGYAILQLLTVAFYAKLPVRTDAVLVAGKEVRTSGVSNEAKSIVRRLAALFALDSFGGGFLGDALISYWFFLRYGLNEKQLGLLFFVVHLLNAGSHLGAAWLAKRIGLVNTMVFTHLPSSLLLLAVPAAPTAKIAIALFILRESLVEMDVPTRQSYVAAIVKPHERTYASALTNLTRTVAWAGASAMAGVTMQLFSFSAPLVLGGSLKITYDLLLYRSFQHLGAPEERVGKRA